MGENPGWTRAFKIIVKQDQWNNQRFLVCVWLYIFSNFFGWLFVWGNLNFSQFLSGVIRSIVVTIQNISQVILKFYYSKKMCYRLQIIVYYFITNNYKRRKNDFKKWWHCQKTQKNIECSVNSNEMHIFKMYIVKYKRPKKDIHDLQRMV